jgi:hypothetical protein
MRICARRSASATPNSLRVGLPGIPGGLYALALVKALGLKTFLTEPRPHIAFDLFDGVFICQSIGHNLFTVAIRSKRTGAGAPAESCRTKAVCFADR